MAQMKRRTFLLGTAAAAVAPTVSRASVVLPRPAGEVIITDFELAKCGPIRCNEWFREALRDYQSIHYDPSICAWIGRR